MPILGALPVPQLSTSVPNAPTAPVLQVLVGDLRTGLITARVPVEAATWQEVLNAPGNITGVAIRAGSADLADTDLYHTTAPAKAFVAIQYASMILNAGPIWTRTYNRREGRLTLGAAGLASLFDHRLVMPVLTEPLTTGAAQAAVTTYPTSSNLSYADIAVALVTQACAHVGGTLPIVYPPAQGYTPGRTRTYQGYDVAPLGQRLNELSAVLGGPEVMFEPRINPADPRYLQWVMRAGTPTQPELTQTGDDWVFDATAPLSPVSDIDYADDATTMATRWWEVGSGSQTGILLAQADSTTLTAAGYPLLEGVSRNHTTDGNQADLDAYAAQSLTENNRPAAVWKLRVRADGGANLDPTVTAGPRLDEYRPGDYVQIRTKGDPFLPDGTRRSRILQIDGDAGFEATLTLATTTAEV